MFDERWPEAAAELGDALDAVLTKFCPLELLRAADAAEPESTNRLDQLDHALRDFGLWELPDDPYLLTRAAVSLGAQLTPVPFVAVMPARLVLGEDGVANGVDRRVIPAGPPRYVVAVDEHLGLLKSPEEVRLSSAGESVVVLPAGFDRPESVHGDADAVRAWGFLLEAARLVGAAHALLRYGVSYISDRRQFGVPVGSFQGVAHPMADTATAVQAADLMTRHAAYLADRENTPPLFAAVMAAAKARAASRQAAAVVHQALGGYGFTIEADCQLYTRRIRAWTAAMPDPEPWLGKLARTLAEPRTRDQVTDLWQFERGFTLPRWARESH